MTSDPASPISVREKSRKRVLLVDDSPTVVYVLRTYLMNLNLDFESAADVRMAMRLLLRNPPDLIVSDIQMPGMDGLNFCRTLRDTPGFRRVHFLLMSSRWTEERRKEAQQLGIQHCLEKPVSAELLAQLVHQLLG